MSSKINKSISIVTPLFNEEHNVVELCERVAKVLAMLPYDYEHICIDNRSSDRTVELLKTIAKTDAHLKIIINTRNFGYIRSSYHALLQSSGDAVILIASDLQDPPEMIIEFIKKWEAGYKTVMAIKPKSEEPFIMHQLRRIFYKIITRISEVPLIQNATGSGLFDRTVINILRNLNEPYPYFRGLLCEIGFPIATVSFTQPRRKRGVSSQNFYSLYDIALLGITKHTKIPLRIMVIFGFCMTIISSLVALCYLLIKLFSWNYAIAQNTTVLISVLLFSSLQIFCIGILGEYVASIQTHVRNMPHTIELERINF
ncbi:MAG: glycosyltransferase family 2 protein [Pseudomonadota bacterium]